MALCLGVFTLGAMGGFFGSVGERIARLGPTAWLGLAVLVLGAVLGFFADALCERFCPETPERSAMFRAVGVGAAFAGTLLALGIL